MHTFIFMATVENKLPEAILHSCKRTINKWIPSLTLSLELAEHLKIFPESNCGWLWLAPAYDDQPVISEFIEERYAVLVYGNVLSDSSHSPAQIILDTYLSGGPIKVRELEGSFSAVVVDRTSGEVVLVGDLLGLRALRYYNDEQTLIVSPHDIPLVATGCFPPVFDYVSAQSIMLYHSSLGNKSLLKHVHPCNPSEYILWSQGRIKHFGDPIINPNRRIAKGDSREISRNLEQMLETAREYLRILIANEPEVWLDLSAGMDTRAVLSLLLSVKPSQKVIVYSRGSASDLDVQIASKLAKMYGINFRHLSESISTPDEFLSKCDLNAFTTNGNSNSGKCITKSSIHPLDRYGQKPVLHLNGQAGEIFRRYYYKQSSPLYKQRPPLLVTEVTRGRTKSLQNQLNKIPWKSMDFQDLTVARLNSIINKFSEYSENGYDILDMFYLYERIRNFEDRERFTWLNRQSPFLFRKLIKLAFMMPSPIGDYAKIHHESIRRFAPRAYWIRINGKDMLLSEHRNFLGHFFGKVFEKVDPKYQTIRRRIQDLLNLKQSVNLDLGLRQNVQGSISLGGSLAEVIRDLLMSEGSFSLELLGQQGLESFLNEYQLFLSDYLSGGNSNHYMSIVSLITMERWKTMVSKAAGVGTSSLGD